MIKPHPNAPQGEVKSLVNYTDKDFQTNSAILCRNTAPLVAFAYQLLQRDVPCKIMGRDIGTQLKKIVEKLRATTLEDLVDRLRTWHERECQKARQEDRSTETLDDQFQCIRFFVDGLDEDSRSVDSLLAKIDLLFTDDTNSTGRVILSTIHRAKGLEWPRVFILDRSLIPSKFATRPEQLMQEYNLGYVAVTRSMHSLFYITSGCWKDGQ